MPSSQNSNTHRYRKGVGTATLVNPKEDKWRMCCQHKGTPQWARRKIVHGINAVAEHFDIVAELLREHGRSKAALLSKIDMDELTICNRQLESLNSESNTNHSMEEVFNLGIEAIKAKKTKQQFPTLNQVIKQYIAYRETPQGNHRGNWVIDKNMLTSEKTFLKSLSKIRKKWVLCDVFNPHKPFKEEAKRWIMKEWAHLAPKSQQDRAKVLRMLLDYAKEHYPTVSYTNPLNGWDSYFNKTSKASGIKTILPVQKVTDLFLAAANNPKWVQNIPYMALSLFAGTRPYDVASPKDKKRRWRWDWFNEWKNISAVSGGFKAMLPAWNEDGTKGSSKKTSVAQERDLTANGYQWITWYYETIAEKDIPTTGKIYFSRKFWDELRKSQNLYAEKWHHDIIRRTFATYAHNHWPNETQYWCDQCGHSVRIYKQVYKGLTTNADAEEFFSITPASLALCEEEETIETQEKLIAVL